MIIKVQSNLSIVFSFVNCDERGYYRIASVHSSVLIGDRTAGAFAECKDVNVRPLIIHNHMSLIRCSNGRSVCIL